MDASNRARKRPTARRAPRRPGCSPPRGDRASGAQEAEGLTVTIRAIPLPNPDTNPLRAQQLAVIVDLLRRAAAQAARKDAASRGGAE
jgi:hypothetical protein